MRLAGAILAPAGRLERRAGGGTARRRRLGAAPGRRSTITLAGGGVDGLERPAVGGGDALAADQKALRIPEAKARAASDRAAAVAEVMGSS